MSNLTTYKGFSIDHQKASEIVEKVIAENGNVGKLTAVERKIYYIGMCDRYQLDPFTNPFDYLEGKGGKLILYPNVRAANNLGLQHNLTIEKTASSVIDGYAQVEVRCYKRHDQRFIDEIGCVEITQMMKRGDALKKAYTQARRRAILAYCGFSDASDVGNEDSVMPAAVYDPPMDAIVVDSGEAGTVSEQQKKEKAKAVRQCFALAKEIGFEDGDRFKELVKHAYKIESFTQIEIPQLMVVIEGLQKLKELEISSLEELENALISHLNTPS